jgi:protein gp37
MTTSIEWTDETWNPVVGCTKVSKGCQFCYAKTLHDKRHKASLAGKDVAPQYAQAFESVQLMPERLDAPLHWRKPRRVFVNSVSDLFHEDVPDEFLQRVFLTMARAPRHTFQILTKRPERMRNFFMRRSLVETGTELYEAAAGRWPLPNVWLGTSVENQEAADERIPELLQTPAAVRFLSCEPLLGPVNIVAAINRFYQDNPFHDVFGEKNGIDWVIAGAESGPKARPCELQWIRSIVSQCRFGEVPVFVKQLGGRPIEIDGSVSQFSKKGGVMEEWPDDLKVREFPRVEAIA